MLWIDLKLFPEVKSMLKTGYESRTLVQETQQLIPRRIVKDEAAILLSQNEKLKAEKQALETKVHELQLELSNARQERPETALLPYQAVNIAGTNCRPNVLQALLAPAHQSAALISARTQLLEAEQPDAMLRANEISRQQLLSQQETINDLRMQLEQSRSEADKAILQIREEVESRLLKRNTEYKQLNDDYRIITNEYNRLAPKYDELLEAYNKDKKQIEIANRKITTLENKKGELELKVAAQNKKIAALRQQIQDIEEEAETRLETLEMSHAESLLETIEVSQAALNGVQIDHFKEAVLEARAIAGTPGKNFVRLTQDQALSLYTKLNELVRKTPCDVCDVHGIAAARDLIPLDQNRYCLRMSVEQVRAVYDKLNSILAKCNYSD